jgi:EmrB/QacA subfamily drug resistance transporter
LTAPPFATSSFLATRKGKLVLAFLCAVAFLDFLDTSIVNVALPSIARDLHFSQQSLQWVLSGYIVTYGGFLLLGGRAADLLGRRRILVAGTALFGLASLAGGLAQNSGMLVGARLVQGLGAAMMSPAALSLLTTTFNYGTDRVKALGAWGAMAGLSSVAGVFLGGVISAGPGWRWVLFVNLPVCALVLVSAFRLIGEEEGASFRGRKLNFFTFDSVGAILGTGGMLLLIFALVRAPDDGWSAARTIGELATAAVILIAFVVNELRHPNPLLPLSIFRIPGLAAADATQVIGMVGFYSSFFFITLYMQNVLHFSPLRAGTAYVPVALMVAIAAGAGTALIPRTGTRPLMSAGALIAAGGVYWLSRIPAHGYYWTDLFPGLVIMAFGLGLVFVGVQTAANAGVPPSLAGLAGALINASLQVGAAFGLAIFSAVATARTRDLLASHATPAVALSSGFHRALLWASVFLVITSLIALRAANTRGEPSSEITGIVIDAVGSAAAGAEGAAGVAGVAGVDGADGAASADAAEARLGCDGLTSW